MTAPLVQRLARGAVVASLVGARFASSSVALAQVPDADRATARVLAQEGQDALDRKDYPTAIDRFDRAQKLIPAPTLALGLARAEVGAGKWVAARETYERILRDPLPPGASAIFARAVVDARKELDALDPRLPTLTVNVSGPSGARVTIDGVPLSVAVIGAPRPADPGTHTVRAESDGVQPAEVTVTLAERKAEVVTLKLDSPAADVKPVHSAGGGGGSLRRTLGFASIGVGGAGLLMGAIAGGVAVGKHGSLANVCPAGHCVGQQSAIDSYHLAASVSTAGFVLGGIFAATGIVLVVTAPKTSTAPETAFAPVVGLGYAGVRGTFR